MCGIYAYFNSSKSFYIPENCKRLMKRGPNDAVRIVEKYYSVAFYRLAIVGVKNGKQPFVVGDITLLCNGEIYNHLDLEEEHKIINESGSDCEVILHLYIKYGIEKTLSLIKGEFAFILIDKSKSLTYFARDPFGIKPLYLSYTLDDDQKVESLELASVPSALDWAFNVNHVYPGHLYTYDYINKVLSSNLCSVIKSNMQ